MSDSGPSKLRVELPRNGFRLAVDFEWEEQVAVLFGPSGSGKSTLFECVLGLHAAARSQIRLSGKWLEDTTRGLRLPSEKRELGWVPQDATLFPHLNVAGNLSFGARRAGAAGERARARAIDVLELTPLLSRNVNELSGGERSRVALARAIASGPSALLLDEPLAALDLPLRARVLPYLLRIRDEFGLPILYITHDPDEAMLIGGTVAVLDGGRVVASGEAREVLWSRAVLPLSEALGLENVIIARGTQLKAGGGDETDAGRRHVETAGGLRLVTPWPVEAGAVVRLGIPADDILIAVNEPQRISAQNVIAARVTRCSAGEGGVFVHVDAGEPLVAKLTERAVRELGIEMGMPVFVVLKAQALRRLA